MRLNIGGALLVLSVLAGCAAPEIKFTRTQCLPVVGDEHTEAVRFVSDFEANGAVPEQQLVFQVMVLDGAGQPVQSRTGKYKDESGNLMAAKGVMVLQSPWVFENINVAIPAPELNAAREDGAAFAEFRLASPDGQVLVRERARLPAEFAAAPTARETRVARAPQAGTQGEPQPAEAPEVASAAEELQGRDPPREAQPAPAPAPAASPPAARNESAAAPPGARRSGSSRRPESVVRESRPTSPPRTSESEAPQARARRDERAATARRPTRETEIEPVPTAQVPESDAPSTARELAPSDAPAGASGVGDTVYTVKASDSLRSISLEHYGDAQYWPLILRANPDVNPLKLKAGDRLVLPALDAAGNARITAPRTAEKPGGSERAETPVYVTKEGDTLPSIARQLYGDSRRWREIYDLNREQLETPSAVRAGQRLRLPAPAGSSDGARPPARP